jgi:polar amino acid transport system permease protein
MYEWDFTFLRQYTLPLLRGVSLTLRVSLLSIFIGTAIALPLVICRRSSSRILSFSSALIIEIFLAAPVLVLLVWMYYCLPLLLPIRLSPEVSAIIAFSLSLSAFVAETIRSGIEAIPRGHFDAAIAMRLSRYQTYRHIVLPQAFRIVLPAMLTQYLTCIKLSSLASVIGVYELLHTANNIALSTYRPLETYSIVAVLFVLIILPINMGVRAIERKWKMAGRTR